MGNKHEEMNKKDIREKSDSSEEEIMPKKSKRLFVEQNLQDYNNTSPPKPKKSWENDSDLSSAKEDVDSSEHEVLSKKLKRTSKQSPKKSRKLSKVAKTKKSPKVTNVRELHDRQHDKYGDYSSDEEEQNTITKMFKTKTVNKEKKGSEINAKSDIEHDIKKHDNLFYDSKENDKSFTKESLHFH